MTAFSSSYGRLLGRKKIPTCKRGHPSENNRTRSNACKTCCAAQQKERRKHSDPAKVKEQSWATKLKMMYGLTKVQYQGMLDAQHGCCAICKRPSSSFSRPLGVDHNHSTGKVRALLCGQCNSGLGMFRDDTTCMRNAIEYLEQHDTID